MTYLTPPTSPSGQTHDYSQSPTLSRSTSSDSLNAPSFYGRLCCYYVACCWCTKDALKISCVSLLILAGFVSAGIAEYHAFAHNEKTADESSISFKYLIGGISAIVLGGCLCFKIVPFEVVKRCCFCCNQNDQTDLDGNPWTEEA